MFSVSELSEMIDDLVNHIRVNLKFFHKLNVHEDVSDPTADDFIETN